MKCIGIFMPVETRAALENDELVMSYLESCVTKEGELIRELPDIDQHLKTSFGQHLRLTYYDPTEQTTTEIPSYYYHLMVVSDSIFHSHERH